MTDYSPEQIAKIGKACDIAGVNYPNFEQTKEWMLGLAEAAQEFKDDRDSYEDAHEIADSEVPYMTYRLWLIWTDLQLYQEWPDMDFVETNESVLPDDIEKIPQMACYEIAVRVLNGW